MFRLEEPNARDGSTVLSHTCEVLRQVKGSGLEKGGFTCGDALFGSVVAAVMVAMELFEVHSTWIIKNNTSFFPKAGKHETHAFFFKPGLDAPEQWCDWMLLQLHRTNQVQKNR